jgi:amino acid permease
MPFAYKTFITHYIGIPIYVFGYLGYKREYERLRSYVAPSPRTAPRNPQLATHNSQSPRWTIR